MTGEVTSARRPVVAVIGAGPAGLMAAEVLAAAGLAVTVYDRMPSAGRKLLMAGRGGLNLTHSEPLPDFLARYHAAEGPIAAAVAAFPPAHLIAWAHGLGQETFVGTSGRIFPKSMKASPVLRAWLKRLEDSGVAFRFRHAWTGWDDAGRVVFRDGEDVETAAACDAVVLALGGASWPRLGSDGYWVELLAREGVGVTALAPANCGGQVRWSDAFGKQFAGTPLKRISVAVGGVEVAGEALVTRDGLEGGAIYALSRAIRCALDNNAQARLTIDLRPDLDEARLSRKLSAPRGKTSTSNFLRKAAGLPPVAIGLMHEAVGGSGALRIMSPEMTARLIKSLPIDVAGLAGIERAISTAGGIRLDALDDNFMLRARPGVFAAGEMLDWEAPTGGYLLQASFATGAAAARGVLAYLDEAGACCGAEGSSMPEEAENRTRRSKDAV